MSKTMAVKKRTILEEKKGDISEHSKKRSYIRPLKKTPR